MTNVLVRQDIDGKLYHCPSEPPGHYAKALSTDVAWHVYEPVDLQDAADGVVQSVATNLGEGLHWINYRPDVEPMQLLDLRELLHSDGPLALWRATRIALKLGKDLRALHEADIYQLLLHPGRVGRLKNQLVLMPTLAGALPPLSEIVPSPGEGWLHYIAPEVLRTRAMQRSLLAGGDVYSLGRLIEAMCVSASVDGATLSPFELARRRVELLDRDPFGQWSASFAPLGELIRAMCAPLPADRPSLDDAIGILEGLASEHAPENVFAGLQRQHAFEQARDCYRDLSEAYGDRVFDVTSRSLHLMAADVALMQSPPDCALAVEELQEAESLNVYEADVQYRLGRAYALWSALPQNLQLSSEAYRRAAGLSGWKPAILEEWTSVLRSDSPTSALRQTDDVPPPARPRPLVELRARCLEVLGDHEAAWDEVAFAFPSLGFSQELFEFAQHVGKNVPPDALISWLYRNEEQSGLEAPKAIVWHFNGNPELAEYCLELAKSRRN
jgi:hypothetical protein